MTINKLYKKKKKKRKTAKKEHDAIPIIRSHFRDIQLRTLYY